MHVWLNGPARLVFALFIVIETFLYSRLLPLSSPTLHQCQTYHQGFEVVFRMLELARFLGIPGAVGGDAVDYMLVLMPFEQSGAVRAFLNQQGKLDGSPSPRDVNSVNNLSCM